MLFKILTRDALAQLVETILESNEVIGPKRVAEGVDGKPIHQYLPVTRFDELELDYETTEFPAKTYFLPYREKLSTFRFDEDDWTQEIRYRIQPRAIVGLHACDINALLKLDKVFQRDAFPSPYYLSRRRNTLVVGIDHMPCEHGFCQSVDANVVTHGFDLFLTDLGDRYFVSIGSDRGFNLVQKVESREVSDEDTHEYIAVRRKISDAFKTHVRVNNLPNLLDLEFESPVWQRWGDKCLSCGSCAMACPTCYCYGVTEHVSMDFTQGAKVKQLHSCNLVDFAMVAGEHNFRPSRESRLKYRYYHQHRGFAEAYDEPKCVGCNRCGRVCLAGINPPDVIADLHEEDPGMKTLLHRYDITRESDFQQPRDFNRKTLLQHVDQAFKAEITNIIELTEMEKLFHVRLVKQHQRERFSFLPGQFVMLEVPGYGEIPISISSASSNKGFLELCIRKAGRVTSVLHKARRGARVGIRGPFGTSFPMAKMKGHSVLLIAGGLGLAPLRAPIFHVTENRTEYDQVHIIYGTRTPEQLLFDYQYEQWRRIDGVNLSIIVQEPTREWSGEVGLITKLVDDIDFEPDDTYAIVCGPPVMFKYVCNQLSKKGVPMHRMFVSLERRMHCGMGKCCRCNIGSTYTCVDGPVFDYWSVMNLKEAI